MAKDPRFNFYVDNWIGGTEGFTLEQDGAYLALLLMQTKIGRFTADQALDKLLQKTRGNTTVCTEMWNFLIQKFATDGSFFWSERLEKEMAKSKRHSEKQSERIQKRWSKENGTSNGNTVVLPVNSTGSGNRIGSSKENNKEKNDYYPSDILRGNEEYMIHLDREALRHKVNLKQTLENWDAWYSNKFTGWRTNYEKDVITTQDLKKSFESWLRDPKSKMVKPNGIDPDKMKEFKNMMKS
jgi:uncharacterized protein YdaU (DUF1376 family)